MEFPDIHSFHEVYDLIIVGAGVEGLATAYTSAKLGRKTLLLEQFALPHTRGSSHGPSRIIRYAHSEVHYAQMIPDVFDTWDRLEQESQTKLFQQTALLHIAQDGNDEEVKKRVAVMQAMKTPFEGLSSRDLQKRYPAATFASSSVACIDYMAGVLRSDKALKCFQNQFVLRGGTLKDEEKVLQILPGNIITVITNKGQYKGKSVAITAGPWALSLLKPLGVEPPIKVWKANVCFFKEKSPGTYAKWPIFLDQQGDGFVYGFPSIDYPGYMKIGYHFRWKEVDPDKRDFNPLNETQQDIEHIKRYVRRHLHGLESEPSIVEPCMYTCTPPEDIIIDSHPVYANIVYACGFSGQGFKLAPAIGRMLCEMSQGKPTTWDLTPFTLETLLQNCKSKL